MMPGRLGLNETVIFPFFPDFTVFEMPEPEILTETPATPFLPLVTFTTIFWLLPFAFRTFGPAVTVPQISGATTGGLGLTVGGVSGATTFVCAEAVLL